MDDPDPLNPASTPPAPPEPDPGATTTIPTPAVDTGEASPPNGLRALGFAGLDALEVPLVVALALGDPVLFVGRHGTGKSALVAAVAKALGLRFQAYDAAKCQFEEMVGFPDPSALARGEFRYIEPPCSIFNAQFVLFDELNRANPAIQSKLLEVVRDRTLLGRSAEEVRYVWAAMNPAGGDYGGVLPLDPALAGRFAWILPLPEASELDPEDLRAAIRFTSPADSPLARFGGGQRAAPAAVGARWLPTIIALRFRLPEAVARWDDAVVEYTEVVHEGLAAEDVALDARRLGMLRRNLVAAFAHPDHRALDMDARGRLVADVLDWTLPHRALGPALDPSLRLAVHTTAWRAAFEAQPEPPRRGRCRVMGERNPTLMAAAWRREAPTLTAEDHDRVLHRLLESTWPEGPERIPAWLDALGVAKALLASSDAFPAELVARVLDWVERTTGLAVEARDDVLPALAAELPPEPGGFDASRSLRLRAALELSRSIPGGGGRPNVASAVSIFGELGVALRRRCA